MTVNELAAKLDAMPRQRLCQLPTPLHRLNRLSDHLGADVWIKRDDLTGFGMNGNKGRKLEFLMGDALAKGATDIVTLGAQQSNHARQTAAAASAFGLPCHLVLTGGPSDTGNQLLYDWLGASVEYIGDKTWYELRDSGKAKRDALEAEGKKPYLIPVGGSSPVGALGFVAAMVELAEQAPPFDRIYFASASLSTQAGLTTGLAFLESQTKPHAVIVGELTREPTEYLAGFGDRIAALLGIERRFAQSDFACDFNHLGSGYAIPTDECIEAIRLLARMEGVFVDPVYSGKAMAGLIAGARSGAIPPSERVLFWHTGGIPTLFAQEYARLPRT